MDHVTSAVLILSQYVNQGIGTLLPSAAIHTRSVHHASLQWDINLVRLHLQVNTLADLTDTKSLKAIHLTLYDGQRPTDWIQSKKWPRQHPPSKQQVRLWKGYIRSSFLRYVPYWKIKPIDSASSPDVSSPPPTIHHTDIFSFIKSLPTCHQRLLHDIEQVASDNTVWRACRGRSRIFVASDGRLHKRQGTFGWRTVRIDIIPSISCFVVTTLGTET
jgi:hypothetical protein